jgi:hypothetical protein
VTHLQRVLRTHQIGVNQIAMKLWPEGSQTLLPIQTLILVRLES